MFAKHSPPVLEPCGAIGHVRGRLQLLQGDWVNMRDRGPMRWSREGRDPGGLLGGGGRPWARKVEEGVALVQRGVEGEEGFHLKNKQTNQKEDPKSSCASVFGVSCAHSAPVCP